MGADYASSVTPQYGSATQVGDPFGQYQQDAQGQMQANPQAMGAQQSAYDPMQAQAAFASGPYGKGGGQPPPGQYGQAPTWGSPSPMNPYMAGLASQQAAGAPTWGSPSPMNPYMAQGGQKDFTSGLGASQFTPYGGTGQMSGLGGGPMPMQQSYGNNIANQNQAAMMAQRNAMMGGGFGGGPVQAQALGGTGTQRTPASSLSQQYFNRAQQPAPRPTAPQGSIFQQLQARGGSPALQQQMQRIAALRGR